MVSIGNSLPNIVVLASSFDTFKTDLIGTGVIKMLNMIDYTAELTGAGSRSEFYMK